MSTGLGKRLSNRQHDRAALKMQQEADAENDRQAEIARGIDVVGDDDAIAVAKQQKGAAWANTVGALGGDVASVVGDFTKKGGNKGGMPGPPVQPGILGMSPIMLVLIAVAAFFLIKK